MRLGRHRRRPAPARAAAGGGGRIVSLAGGGGGIGRATGGFFLAHAPMPASQRDIATTTA